MLTTDSETYAQLSVDGSGRILVTTTIEPDFKLNLYQGKDPEVAPRVLADGAVAAFAPDDKIFFSSGMTGDREIWSISADGSDQRQLTNDRSEDSAPIVSSDNRSVFFTSNRTGELHVWRMGVDGTDQTQITKGEGGYPLRLSPDGRWLYYRSGLRSTLRRVSLPEGGEEIVHDTPADNFAIAPDTLRMAVIRRRKGEFAFEVVSLEDNRIAASFKPPGPAMTPTFLVWSHDGNNLIYITEDGDGKSRSLWAQSLTGEAPKKIADLDSPENVELSGFALSHDAQKFVVAQGIWKHNAMLIKGLRP